MAHWSATCLSSESSDTNLALLVDCNASRYLFNCGEGTTRTLLQRKKGFRKFTALFNTGIDTDRSSGLPGLLMTIADSRASKIKIFGPLGLNHFLASTRLYTMRESLSLNSHEILEPSSSPVYKDENISVFAVPVFPDRDMQAPSDTLNSSKRKITPNHDILSSSSKRQKLETSDVRLPSLAVGESSGASDRSLWDSPGIRPLDLTGETAESWRQLVIQHIFPGKLAMPSTSTSANLTLPPEISGRKHSVNMVQLNKPLPRMSRHPYTLSYIILGAQGRGKFDSVKASSLGLPSGPLRGRLTKGETIVTPKGKTITPEMVLGPAPLPDATILIDCPSPDYIPSLSGSKEFASFQSGGEYPVHCMFHLVGPKVLDDIRYHQWLDTFGNKVHHLVAGPDITPDRITFTSSAYAQLRLSHLDSEIFQVPKRLLYTSNQTDIAMMSTKMELLRHNHIVGMKPAKAPAIPPDDDGVDLYHPAVQKGGDHDISSLLQPKTINAFNDVKKKIAEECKERIFQPGDNVTVTPLGTSSAMPSKYRNVSALIVQIPGSGNILLDCGEGTMGQLRRHFGEKTTSVLRDIKCIFISHLHGDHHMGISKVLSQRRKLEPPCFTPIYLIANQATLMYLQEYNDLENLGLNDPVNGVQIIYAEHACGSKFHKPQTSVNERIEVRSSHTAIRDLKSILGLASITTVEVWHRGRCYGLVIKHIDDWSIVYSGDTRPSDNLIRAGQNATLLIHEATLGDDQAEIAVLKAHSTIGQAIDVAKRMKAKNVLLTHFSNRFPKTPQMTTGPTEASDPTICIAFDHATISIGDLWKLNRYLPAIEQSFIDSEDPEDEIVPTGDAP
ncbi:Metallo-hydrolase/oxidoreductase [Ramaria rubella]|nr:Metallo-hydrolase/oxidoreductase [Ramaria rubella]